MIYKVTLPESMGCDARSHYGIGTFLVGVPREVDISPEAAESLRVKGYRVEEIREHAPKGQQARKEKLAEQDRED